MRALLLTSVIALSLAACARTSVMQTSADTLQVSARAARVCGREGAQRVAFQQAAIETIRRGYDSFVIYGADYENTTRVVGHTPVIGHTTGSAFVSGNMVYGSAQTTYSGGAPIIGGRHYQDIQVKMFKIAEAGSEQAIDARVALGPEWPNLVEKGVHTCN